MRPHVVVLTRDLRVRDNPALWAAATSGAPVVPLFVLDDVVLRGSDALPQSPNRVGFLLESLRDLDASLRARGSALALRRGRWADEVAAIVASTDASHVHVADDVSRFAQRRLVALHRALAGARLEVVLHPAPTVVPPDALTPAGGGEFKVFTPYFRRWAATPWRAALPAPEAIATVDADHALHPSALDLRLLDDVAAALGPRSPGVAPGGETAGTARLRTWAAASLAAYDERRDDLAAADTSQISAHLHLGTLSALEVATRLRDRPGAGPFVRQLCWRDFYAQILAAVPEAATRDYREREPVWVVDDEALGRWLEGRTGFPVVDAAMRQLRGEGFVHNRARMVVASFLTKDLGIDWREGARHYLRWLVDGDVASNQLNWQWVAGTGTDTNPHRIFNPTVQSKRFDPTGAYVQRWVPELAEVGAPEVHDPRPDTRRRVGYVAPVLDHHEAIAAYRLRRGG